MHVCCMDCKVTGRCGCETGVAGMVTSALSFVILIYMLTCLSGCCEHASVLLFENTLFKG